MVTDFPIQAILDHLVTRIVEIMPVTAVGVTLISLGLDPHYVAASDGDALRFEQLQSELGEGPCLAAYRTGEVISVPDLRDAPEFASFASRALDIGLAAVFAFPLRHESVRLGALDLYRETPGALLPDAMATAQTLADVAAAYLINAQARADLQDASNQSRDAALHDPLTGLATRVLTLERVDHASRRARRSGKTSAVFFVDLDEFKAVNDTYGHRVGDELLVAVARRLTGVLRPGDTLARLYGDEFVILCEDLDDTSQADTIAARVEAQMALPFALSAAEVRIGASIGIAFTGKGIEGPEELIDSADLAMYRSKRRKRGTHGILDLRDLERTEHHLGLARSLGGAVTRGEIHLDYQPIVDAADGRITGAEALMRWTHPTRGPVPPSVFIPFAEHSGEIVAMEQWVLEQAWRDRHRWQRHRAEDITLSINVSPHQFMAPHFADTVAAALEVAPGDPALLTLEVTESFSDRQRALVVLSELKELGVKLALDDFGTGYSSLSYLTRFPIDAVKLDRALVATLSSDRASRTMVTTVLQLAHGLGMTVISAGVETAEQHHELIALGCNSCQGFYFARPMSASSLEALIQRQAAESNPHLPLQVRGL